MAEVSADNSARLPYDQVLVDVVSYVFHYEVTSSRAWERAKIALFDALGCAFETLTESREARDLIGSVVEGTIVPNGFRLPGTSLQLDPVKGAFDLGSLIRYLDHSDAFPGAEWGHPSGKTDDNQSQMDRRSSFSTDNIGAILAVADHLSRTTTSPPLTMRTVLHALIKAYEIQGCFQIRNAFNQHGLDHTILVRIAATAVVAHLLGLSESQTLAALSHAFIDAGPLRAYRQSPNAGPRKGWAAGDACMRAVHLTLLAKKGQPGAPTVLTDPKWGLYTSLLHGKEFQLPKPFATWVVESAFFKIHAAEGHAASAVEAALTLAHRIRSRGPTLNMSIADAINHIRVRTQRPAMIIINKQGPLQNAADRDHCMQYMIAVVLLKGSMITSADYDDNSPWAMDPRVEILRRKIEMVEDEQFTADYHDDEKRSAANALQVTLLGEVMEEVLVEYPMGHPWREDTTGLVRQKFEENVKGLFKGGQAEEIIGLAELGVEEFEYMGVKDFMDTMVLAEEEGKETPPVDDAGLMKTTSHDLAMAEIPPVDDLTIYMPGFTPQQVASLENMMNATIKAALDERLGSKPKTGTLERASGDSAVDLIDDDVPVDPKDESLPAAGTAPADSLTIEMPGFAEEQVSSLEAMLNTTVKTALDERLGPRPDGSMVNGASSSSPPKDDVDMVDENVSPRGSLVDHLGVNGVEDGSRFAC